MANDLDYFYKLHKNSYADSEAAAIQAAKDAANANIKLIEDNYGTQIADAKAAYDPLFRQNEIQRAVNERYLERRAAEMGLTDSGLSRTQQTANQLSYANQNAEYMRQRQKAVDTLKAAMDAKILEQNTNLNTNIAGIKTTYADKRTADAVSMYNEAVKSDAEIEKERLKYANDAAKTADGQFNDLYKRIYKERQDGATKDAFGNLTYNNNPVHLDMIYDYQKQSGLPTDSTQMKMLLEQAGTTAEEYSKQYGNRLFEETGNFAFLVPTETKEADFLKERIISAVSRIPNKKVRYERIMDILDDPSIINMSDLSWNEKAWILLQFGLISEEDL